MSLIRGLGAGAPIGYKKAQMKSFRSAIYFACLFSASVGVAQPCWKYLTGEPDAPLTGTNYLVYLPEGTHVMMKDSFKKGEVSGLIAPIVQDGYRLRNMIFFKPDKGSPETIGLSFLKRVTVDAVPGFRILEPFALNDLQDALPFLPPGSRFVAHFEGEDQELKIATRRPGEISSPRRGRFVTRDDRRIDAPADQLRARGLLYVPDVVSLGVGQP